MQPMRSIPCMLKDDPFSLSTCPLYLALLFTNLITSLSPQTQSHNTTQDIFFFSMASNTLHPVHRHKAATPRLRRHSLDTSSPPPLPSSLFLKPIKTTFPSFTLSATSSPSTAAVGPTTNLPTTFEVLQQHLEAQNFREADEETRRLIIQLAGEAAQKRGYVFFSEVQFISKQGLQTIDSLWRQHSNNRYGYSVQRRIWKKAEKDFTKFFIKLGWMKKLENSEVEQFNYKAFPNEFYWELKEDTPEGHLPLTNALRGTQLFNYILEHPAFVEMEEQEDKDGGGFKGNFITNKTEKEEVKEPKTPLSNRVFKTDYSF